MHECIRCKQPEEHPAHDPHMPLGAPVIEDGYAFKVHPFRGLEDCLDCFDPRCDQTNCGLRYSQHIRLAIGAPAYCSPARVVFYSAQYGFEADILKLRENS